MSLLDSFTNKRFYAAKCKTLLKLTIPRIKLLRNRREIQLKQMRRDIAKLLETGQEATARIRVEHIIREEKMMAAQEIVELFCELIAVRLPIIEAQRECPLDLKEAISSVCFAAPRCADLTELLQVPPLFAAKYGKEFVAAATELMPECGVNRQLVELLSIRAPAPEVKLKLLKDIAEEHELDWDPSGSENELLKPHEDLLNGPSQFVSGSKLPLPKENHDEFTHTASKYNAPEHPSNFDDDFDIIDFPEVPSQPLHSNKGTVSAPEMLPFPSSAFSEVDDQEETETLKDNDFDDVPQDFVQEKSVTKEGKSPNIPYNPPENEHFVPFISPPSHSPVREFHSRPSISNPKSDKYNIDLQEVLAAAHAAADSADRAAAAARAAASIAQLRISELVKKNNEKDSNSTEVDLDKQNSFGYNIDSPLSSSPSKNNDDAKGDFDSSPCGTPVSNHATGYHQPQRLPSLDEEPIFTYPNLFKSQGSNLSSGSDSFKDGK